MVFGRLPDGRRWWGWLYCPTAGRAPGVLAGSQHRGRSDGVAQLMSASCGCPAVTQGRPFPSQLGRGCPNCHVWKQSTVWWHWSTDPTGYRGKGDTETNCVPALDTPRPCTCCWCQSVLGSGEVSLCVSSTLTDAFAAVGLSKGWTGSAAGQSVGGGGLSLLGNIKQ